MTLKICCFVFAMRNVRHGEIDDVGLDAIKTTQDVRGKRSYIEQEKFGGCWSPLLPFGNTGQESHRRLMRSARTLQGRWARRGAAEN